MDISAVIPTRNRKESLYRLLKSLNEQTLRVKEVIIIDSSDELLSPATLQSDFPNLTTLYKTSVPAACIQRNEGIKIASASHIFLCPDDLEVPQEYLSSLVHFLQEHPEAGAVSGLLFEPDENGVLAYHFPTVRLRGLIWKLIFQQSVWADLSVVETTTFGKPVLSLCRQYYSRKANTYSLAGWPLVTQIESPFFRTALFSMGGAVIRRDWLLQSPYDEILDQHGIGDNYGVTLNFPEPRPVWVTSTAFVVHHKVQENRLPKDLTYFRRILALHYFMKFSPKFSTINHLFLLWSLVGNLIYFIVKNQPHMRRATSRAMLLIATGQNPYVLAKQNGNSKCITPML